MWYGFEEDHGHERAQARTFRLPVVMILHRRRTFTNQGPTAHHLAMEPPRPRPSFACSRMSQALRHPRERDSVRSVQAQPPQPPPLVGPYSDVNSSPPTAPVASQFTDRASSLLAASGSTVVAPEIGAIPSTGPVPPYWRSGENGQPLVGLKGATSDHDDIDKGGQ